MSSQCTVADDWNLSSQRQEQVETTDQLLEEEAARRFPCVHSQLLQNPNNIHNFAPLPNYGVTELTWENGHPTMHGLGGLNHYGPPKPTWVSSNETLESIVHQATNHNKKTLINPYQHDHQTNPNTKIFTASDYHAQLEPTSSRKRRFSDSDMFAKSLEGTRGVHKDHRACASASARFCRDHTNDTDTMACASFASPPSLKAKTTTYEDLDCIGPSAKDENLEQDEDHKTEVTARSHSSRRTRAAAVHNLSERRRRDRINQKMRDLQKLVPNANKTDKSSMLDEIISYLKQLQAQVHLMSSARNSSTPHHQPMMPLGMQQQYLQMSLLAARMGMNTTDMFGMSNLARGPSPCLPTFVHPAMATAGAVATPATFVHPPNLLVPPIMVPHVRPNEERPSTSCLVPLHDPYGAFLAQSMNMDLYRRMATLWGQQIHQVNQGSNKLNLQDD